MGTDSLRHPLTRTLLVLTLTTGVIDAACYLGLGRVFAANMTGNVVLLGFGIAGVDGAAGGGSADSQLAGGRENGNWRRGAAVWSMLIGAVIGALLVKADLALVLLAAAGLALVTWLVFMPGAITTAE